MVNGIAAKPTGAALAAGAAAAPVPDASAAEASAVDADVGAAAAGAAARTAGTTVCAADGPTVVSVTDCATAIASSWRRYPDRSAPTGICTRTAARSALYSGSLAKSAASFVILRCSASLDCCVDTTSARVSDAVASIGDTARKYVPAMMTKAAKMVPPIQVLLLAPPMSLGPFGCGEPLGVCDVGDLHSRGDGVVHELVGLGDRGGGHPGVGEARDSVEGVDPRCRVGHGVDASTELDLTDTCRLQDTARGSRGRHGRRPRDGDALDAGSRG